jgi:hypothetical protein
MDSPSARGRAHNGSIFLRQKAVSCSSPCNIAARGNITCLYCVAGREPVCYIAPDLDVLGNFKPRQLLVTRHLRISGAY